MSSNKDFHNHISDYIESKRREFITPDFGYASYTSPNSTFSVGNDLPDLMLKLTTPTLRFWLKALSSLTRSSNPVLAVTILVRYEDYKELVGRTNYYAALKELQKYELLLATPKKSIYIVNVKYANKLYKPKMDL